ncbi:MAG: hypothetical protein JST32_19645, partial [Bacteroidetes bacterium]|nr:hypothetical protein [Bacteroidota bacterium]
MKSFQFDKKYHHRPLRRNPGILFVALISFFTCHSAIAQQNFRKEILLNNNWRTVADTANINAYNGFEKAEFKDQNWITVDVPHNWDTYG